MIRLPSKVEVNIYALLSDTILATLRNIEFTNFSHAHAEKIHEAVMLDISEVFDFEDYYHE